MCFKKLLDTDLSGVLFPGWIWGGIISDFHLVLKSWVLVL